MQSNHIHPHISAYNPRNSEKQRFSLKSLGTNSHTLPLYMTPQDQYATRTSMSSILALFADLGKRIARLAQYRSSTHPASYSKEMTSSSRSSQSTTTFVMLCALWYSSSALSSNTGKAILNRFRYPITLTFVQFGFVAFYCLLFMSPPVRFTRLRAPSKAIFMTTLPMGMFQVGGHMFSSVAISRIPVSTVHTIKVVHPSSWRNVVESSAQSRLCHHCSQLRHTPCSLESAILAKPISRYYH
jgi:solute carrier family 35 protein E1